MNSPISWQNLWMEMALLVSKRSKDPNTKCGCLLVSPDNRHIAIGYNGFASGIPENDFRWTRPEKYRGRIIHAETNAILNCRQNVENWTAYITMVPCPSCSSNIIQSGIKKIVYLNEPSSNAFDYNLSFELLKEAGITVEKFNHKEQK